MPRSSGAQRNRRGASLALAAVCMFALIGVGALAIDLGMLYKARADALYAAEAAALAGASAFLDSPNYNSTAVQQEAVDRAREYAHMNRILTDTISVGVVTVQVIPAELKVRVKVGPVSVGTWFAAVFNEGLVPVSAVAAAAVEEGDAVDCVSPFMIPDTWAETGEDNVLTNGWEDSAENWTFDAAQGDGYDQADNGFGSDYRNGQADESSDQYTADFGRRMILQPSPPAGGGGGAPGRTLNTWDFWAFDEDDPDLDEAVEIDECREGAVGMGDELRGDHGRGRQGWGPSAPAGADAGGQHHPVGPEHRDDHFQSSRLAEQLEGHQGGDLQPTRCWRRSTRAEARCLLPTSRCSCSRTWTIRTPSRAAFSTTSPAPAAVTRMRRAAAW